MAADRHVLENGQARTFLHVGMLREGRTSREIPGEPSVVIPFQKALSLVQPLDQPRVDGHEEIQN